MLSSSPVDPMLISGFVMAEKVVWEVRQCTFQKGCHNTHTNLQMPLITLLRKGWCLMTKEVASMTLDLGVASCSGRTGMTVEVLHQIGRRILGSAYRRQENWLLSSHLILQYQSRVAFFAKMLTCWNCFVSAPFLESTRWAGFCFHNKMQDSIWVKASEWLALYEYQCGNDPDCPLGLLLEQLWLVLPNMRDLMLARPKLSWPKRSIQRSNSRTSMIRTFHGNESGAIMCDLHSESSVFATTCASCWVNTFLKRNATKPKKT